MVLARYFVVLALVPVGAVWSFGVVMHPPPLDQNLRFLQGVEQLSVQKLISQFAIKAFIIAILPRTSGLI